MRQALRRWWRKRAWREQTTMSLALAVLVLGLAYGYLWQPVSRDRDRLLLRVPELRAELQVMQREAQELERVIPLSRNEVNLRAAVEKAAADAGATLSVQIVAESPDRVRTIVPAATREQAFRWVARLQANGLRLNNVRFAPLGDGDRVKVEVLIGEAR